MKLGIAVLPDRSSIEKLVEIQRMIDSFERLEPVLSYSGNLPHVTVLQGRFRSLDYINCILPQFRRYIEDIREPLKLESIGVKYVQAGWYFLKVNPSNWLMKFHLYVFKMLMAEMYLTDEDKMKDISNYNDQEKENYLEYGYRYILDAYSPHITIGRTHTKNKSNKEDKLIELVEDYMPKEILFSRLTVYRFGKNGSHAEILAAIDI